MYEDNLDRLSLAFDNLIEECELYYNIYEYLENKTSISRDTIEILFLQPAFTCESLDINNILRRSEDDKDFIYNLRIGVEGIIRDIWDAIVRFFKWVFGISENNDKILSEGTVPIKERAKELLQKFKNMTDKELDDFVANSIKDKLSKIKIIDITKTDFKSEVSYVDSKAVLDILMERDGDKSQETLKNIESNVSTIKDKIKNSRVPGSNFCHQKDIINYFDAMKKQDLDKIYNSKIALKAFDMLKDNNNGFEITDEKLKDEMEKYNKKYVFPFIKNIKFVILFKIGIQNTFINLRKNYILALDIIEKAKVNDNSKPVTVGGIIKY